LTGRGGKGFGAQPSPPLSASRLLELDDGTLGAMVCSAMSWGAGPDSYEALGRILRAGIVVVGTEALELVIRRRKR
jgi:hypothetical protein